MTMVFRQWLGGALLFVVLCVAIVSPRATSTVLVLGLLAILARTLIRRSQPPSLSTTSSGLVASFAFVGFAALSALWSATPLSSVLKPAYAAVALATVWLLHDNLPRLSTRQLDFLAEAFLVATAIGMVFLAIEILTAQAITRAVMTLIPSLHETLEKKHVRVVKGAVRALSDTNLNRRMALLIWLMWPVLMLASLDAHRWRGRVVATVVVIGAAVVLLLGSHQSSQLAILGGLGVFFLARLNVNATRRALTVTWVVATLLVVPLALLAFQARLHEQPWLFRSAQHRVVIWALAAGEVLKSPLTGVGADATRKAMRAVVADEPPREDLAGFKSGYADHAHNVYLQVWYELGAVGAALFLAIGLAALRATSRLTDRIQPFALALFATTGLMISFSYGLWQTWFIAACALSVCALLLATEIDRGRDRKRTADAPDS